MPKIHRVSQLLNFLHNHRTVLWIIAVIGAIIELWIWLWSIPSYPDKLGFNGKTLYDALSVVLVPVAVVAAGLIFSHWQKLTELQNAAAERESEQKIAHDREEETALQSYFAQMTNLLLTHGLHETTEHTAKQRIIARALTLTTLRRLNSDRKGILINFLYESELIGSKPIVPLRDANLEGANFECMFLAEANFVGTNLARANLKGTIFIKAILVGVNLTGANLAGANLREAHLDQANLENANLKKAILERAQLASTILINADLEGADLTGANINEAHRTTDDIEEYERQKAIYVENISRWNK